MNKSSLTSGKALFNGTAEGLLKSSNGKYTLRMQKDGDLVVYQQQLKGEDIPIWASRTDNTEGQQPFRLEMQWDNDLCIYDGEHKLIWASRTRGRGKAGAWVTLEVKNTLIESKMLT